MGLIPKSIGTLRSRSGVGVFRSYSWHKVHSRDVALYYELEKSWDFTVGRNLSTVESMIS